MVADRNNMQKFLTRMEPQQRRYKSCFLMPEHDKLVPLRVENIAYVYVDVKTIIVTNQRKNYFMNITLDDMMDQFDPEMFFRANRKFIVARNAIKDVSIWFGNKLVINLNVDVPEKIVVSKASVSEFKNWFLNCVVDLWPVMSALYYCKRLKYIVLNNLSKKVAEKC